ADQCSSPFKEMASLHGLLHPILFDVAARRQNFVDPGRTLATTATPGLTVRTYKLGSGFFGFRSFGFTFGFCGGFGGRFWCRGFARFGLLGEAKISGSQAIYLDLLFDISNS